MLEEPDFEFRQLARFIVGPAVPSGVPYRELFANFLRQTLARVRMRAAGAERWSRIRRLTNIDDIRRFKGL
jgi:hypothetical protein